MKFHAASKKGLCAFLALSVSTSTVPVMALANGDMAGQETALEASVEEDETSEEETEDNKEDEGSEEDEKSEESETSEEDEKSEESETSEEDEKSEESETSEEDEKSEESETFEEDEKSEESEETEDEKSEESEETEDDKEIEDEEPTEEEENEAIVEEKTEEVPLMTLNLEEETAPVAEEQDGLAFDGDKNYAVTKEAIAIPDSVEMWVKLDQGQDRRQIIMNNYVNYDQDSWGLEVNSDNTLRYWECIDGETGRIDIKFDGAQESSGYVRHGKKIDVCTGEWMKLKVVRNKDAKTVDIYINDVLQDSVSIGDLRFSDVTLPEITYFGTDGRMKYKLSGEIGEVSMYNNGALAHQWDFGDTDGVAYNTTVVTDKAGDNDITTAGYEERPVAGERQGLDFKGSAANGNYARTEEPIEIPDTVEVWVKLKENENRRQIIMNNYLKEDTKSWGLEVNADNTLRYWENVNGGSNGTDRISYLFEDVNICTDEWMLISVVRNKNAGKVDVYIDGEYKTSGNMLTDEWKFTDTELSTPTYIGTDLRKTYWLNGKIGEMRMFSDARTPEEIKAYYNGTETNTDDLEHCWDFGDIDGKAYDSTVVEDTVGSNDIITEGFEANVEDCSGLVFDSEDGDYVQVQGAIDIPVTTEIRVKLDKDSTLNRQILMNNYGKDGASWGLEVAAGTDNLRHWASKDTTASTVFSDVPIKTGEWMLISVVRDATKNELRVYVDGKLKQTVSMEAGNFKNAKLENWLCFGSDYHENPIYFDGEINEVRMWSDVRTDEEIAEYYKKSVKGNEAGLAHAWSFASVGGAEGSKNVYSDTVFADKVKTGGFAVKAVGYPDDPNTEYTVKFSIAGATVTAGDAAALVERTQKVNTLVTDPNVTLERGGSTFKGWFKDAACTIPWNFGTDKVTADTTIYAGFQYNYASAELGELNGVKFGLEEQLCAEQALTEAPLTFEATVKLDKNLEGRGGIICGNYADFGYYNYSIVYTSFEVAENGQPRLYWKLSNKNSKGTVQSIVIPDVDLRQDEWVHVAMTFDAENDKVYCYINGELASVVEDCKLTPKVPTQALKVGGDYRGTGGHGSKDLNRPDDYNGQYFKGEIANVSVWSDVRTAEEIKADFEAVKAGNVTSGKDNLQASWNFNVADGYTAKEYKELDLTGENDLYIFKDWLNPAFAEGSYSMIALPDTQFLSQTYKDIYKDMTQWIADHKDVYNIKAVMHLGDMVNTINDTQLNNCVAATDILDENGVAWMPMQGNHDIGSSSREWDARYTYDEYSKKPWFVDSYGKTADGKDSLRHTCWGVEAGGREYLIFSLGWNPKKDALDWAENIIKENPDKNVILTAHAYMYVDGTQLNDEDMDWPTPSGNDIWDQLGKYPNVVLAIGGHIGYPDLARRTDKNGAGKDVSSILCDAQGIDNTYGLGMLMMLTFHEGSDEVDINWYSVDNDQMFRDRNQFKISVPHVGEDEGGNEGGGNEGGNEGGGNEGGGNEGGNEGGGNEGDDNTGDDNKEDDNTSSKKSSSSKKKYSVNVDDTKHGEIKTNTTRAKKGSTVTITVTPEDGYELDKVTVTDEDGDKIKVKDLGNGKYSFVMPRGEVEIDPVFKKVEEKAEPAEEAEGKIILTIGNIAARVFGEVVINDVPPVIRNERTMLPARFVAEALGATVTWNEAEQKVTIAKEETKVEIYMGQTFALVNGAPVQLDAPAYIENGRTYLPVRLIAEGLNALVDWNSETQEITITPNK